MNRHLVGLTDSLDIYRALELSAAVHRMEHYISRDP